MTAPLLHHQSRLRLTLRAPAPSRPPLDLDRLTGRLTELSEPRASGVLTLTAGLLRQGQDRGEAAAWVATGPTVFYPPDLAFRGLDLAGLTVVRVPRPAAGLGAADTLLRSGAFGVVVVDWSGGAVDEASLGRLAKLAEHRKAALVFLTRKTDAEPSLGSQVSLRLGVRAEEGGARAEVLKDKRPDPASVQREAFRGPFGLY